MLFAPQATVVKKIYVNENKVAGMLILLQYFKNTWFNPPKLHPDPVIHQLTTPGFESEVARSDPRP